MMDRERRRRRRRWWHAYGQHQLEVAALPGHETGSALVPAVPPAERRPRRGHQAADRRPAPGDVELQPAAAYVAALQQPHQLGHSAGLRLRTRLLDRGQCDPLVRSGVCLSRHPADHLSRGHHLPVCPAHDSQHLPVVLGRLAPELWPLASYHGGVPLLQGHHHLSRTPAQGQNSYSLSVHLQEMHHSKTAQDAPLQHLQHLYFEDGPPLSLVEQLRGPLQPPLLLLLLPLHDAGLLLLQRQQQSPVSGGLRSDREILSDPSSNRHLHRDHCSKEYHLPLGADQHGGFSSRRTHPLAQHTHQQSRDQRGASHQPQRDQKTAGEGQGVQKPLSPRYDEQLEVAVGCGRKEALGHAGPLALQPSSQRGRHHVGLYLHQNRPHGHLILSSKPDLKKMLTCIETSCDQLGTKKRSSAAPTRNRKLCSFTERHGSFALFEKWEPHGNKHSLSISLGSIIISPPAESPCDRSANLIHKWCCWPA